MDILIGIVFLVVVAFAYVAGSEHDLARRGRSRLGSAARAFRKFNSDNVELWERYLRSQRPWETTRR